MADVDSFASAIIGGPEGFHTSGVKSLSRVVSEYPNYGRDIQPETQAMYATRAEQRISGNIGRPTAPTTMPAAVCYEAVETARFIVGSALRAGCSPADMQSQLEDETDLSPAAITSLRSAMERCSVKGPEAASSGAGAAGEVAVPAGSGSGRAGASAPSIGRLHDVSWSVAAVVASSKRPTASGIAAAVTLAIDVADPDGAEGYDRGSGEGADGDVGGVRRAALELSVEELRQLRRELGRVQAAMARV